VLNKLVGSPILLFAALLPFCLAAVFVVRRAGLTKLTSNALSGLLLAALGAAVLAHIWFALNYLGSAGFRDHIEPNIAIVAWLFTLGEPVYHAIDAAERYSYLYGPLAYMATGLAYKLIGASTLTAKLAGFVCLVITMIGITAAASRRYPNQWRPVLVALGYFSLLSLFFKNHSFWSKPDPFMMAAIAFGLFACMMNSRRAAWLACGICVGVAVSAKITGAIYFLPVVAWFFQRDGFKAVLIIGIFATVVAAAPFLLTDNVSLMNYIAWLRSAGNHGIDTGLLIQNLLFTLFACIPVLLYLVWEWGAGRGRFIAFENKWVTLAAGLAIALTLVAGSKPGSGPHHLLPFLPMLAFFTAFAFMEVTADSSKRAAYVFWAPMLGFLAAAIIKSTVALYYGFILFNAGSATDALVKDLNDIAESYPERNIYMGYGDGSSYPSTFVRNNLVYAGNPYFLDAPAMMDIQFSGIEIPQATIDRLLADDTAVWLVPAGQEPFTIVSWYYRFENGMIFDSHFRDVFKSSFQKVRSTENFDIYIRD
jgi:hypothetical protein